jgi:putative molybdopterin biosynthesis protein
VEEDYHLVCLKAALALPAVARLLAVLQGAGWQGRLAALPGYEPLRCGEVLSLRRQLPWWNLPPKRTKKALPR